MVTLNCKKPSPDRINSFIERNGLPILVTIILTVINIYPLAAFPHSPCKTALEPPTPRNYQIIFYKGRTNSISETEWEELQKFTVDFLDSLAATGVMYVPQKIEVQLTSGYAGSKTPMTHGEAVVKSPMEKDTLAHELAHLVIEETLSRQTFPFVVAFTHQLEKAHARIFALNKDFSDVNDWRMESIAQLPRGPEVSLAEKSRKAREIHDQADARLDEISKKLELAYDAEASIRSKISSDFFKRYFEFLADVLAFSETGNSTLGNLVVHTQSADDAFALSKLSNAEKEIFVTGRNFDGSSNLEKWKNNWPYNHPYNYFGPVRSYIGMHLQNRDRLERIRLAGNIMMATFDVMNAKTGDKDLSQSLEQSDVKKDNEVLIWTIGDRIK